MIDSIFLRGRLTADPELRYTPQGAAVTNFRIAASDSRYNQDTQQWDTVRQLFLPVTIWNESGNKQNLVPWAELAAELSKGQQVTVHGRLFTNEWQTKGGEKRSRIELIADEVTTRPAGHAPKGASSQPANTGGFGATGGDEQPPF